MWFAFFSPLPRVMFVDDSKSIQSLHFLSVIWKPTPPQALSHGHTLHLSITHKPQSSLLLQPPTPDHHLLPFRIISPVSTPLVIIECIGLTLFLLSPATIACLLTQLIL